MAAVLEARAVIRGEDQTKAAFESVKARVTALAQHIAVIERAMGAVGKVAPLASGSAGDMAKLTGVLARVDDASRSAQRSTLSLTESLKGEMEAVKLAASALREAGMPTEQLASEQQRLGDIIAATTAAIEKQSAAEGASIAVSRRAAEFAAKAVREEERIAHRRREIASKNGVGHLVAGTVGGYVAAHGMLTGIEHGAIDGASLQHTKNIALAAGIPAADVDAISEQALGLSGRYKNVSQESLIELAKEARSVMTDPSEVAGIMPTLAAAKSVLDITDKSGEASAGLGFLVKGSENIGAAKYPERLAKLIDGYVKATQVMGKTISPEQIYEFDKYSKLAGARLSDRFLMTTGLSLSQEMGGSSAGLSMAGLYKQLHGGMDNMHVPAQEFASIGLIDPQDIQRNKVGDIKGLKHGKHVKGYDLDPDQFTYDVLLPALEKSGVTKEADQLSFVQRAFPNSKVADLVGKLIVQRASYAAHARMYANASGLAGADQMGSDATYGLNALTTQLSTFAGVMAEPAMKEAGTILTAMAGGISAMSAKLAEFNKDHPNLAPAVAPAAAAAGLGAAGALSGFVLRGSVRAFGRYLGLGGVEAVEGAGAAEAGTIGAAGMALPLLAAGAAAGGGIYLLSHIGPNLGQHGRAEPKSQKDSDAPGHVAIGRGGAPIWVPDPGSGTHPLVVPDHKLDRLDAEMSTIPTAPADPWLTGERQAIERRAEISANAFRRDPEAARGAAMMGMSQQGPLTVSLDPNSKVESSLTIKLDISPDLRASINDVKSMASGSAKAGAVNAGASPGTGPSYAVTAPTGRSGGQFGRGGH